MKRKYKRMVKRRQDGDRHGGKEEYGTFLLGGDVTTYRQVGETRKSLSRNEREISPGHQLLTYANSRPAISTSSAAVWWEAWDYFFLFKTVQKQSFFQHSHVLISF